MTYLGIKVIWKITRKSSGSHGKVLWHVSSSRFTTHVRDSLCTVVTHMSIDMLMVWVYLFFYKSGHNEICGYD